MKQLGYWLIAVGFISGSFLAVRDEQIVLWGYFVVALGVGTVGAALVQLAKQQTGRKSEHLKANAQQLEESLAAIVQTVRELNKAKETLATDQVHHLIDEQLTEKLSNFVDVRESLSHLYGLQGYADVMTHFATGERYLNRVWSASADGYIDEVHRYLEKAEEQFVLTQKVYEQLELTAQKGSLRS